MFIELTLMRGTKVMINVNNISHIDEGSGRTWVHFNYNLAEEELFYEVRESYEEVCDLLKKV